MYRKTLAKEISYSGIGLHKGENIDMRLIPHDKGIIFVRKDLEEGKNQIVLDIENTFDLTRGTNLHNEYGSRGLYNRAFFISTICSRNNRFDSRVKWK